MNNGVVILCMNKPQYAAAAFNLAFSIKHHSKVHITLLSDGVHRKLFQAQHYSPFDWIKEISYNSICEAKLSLHKHTPYDKTLYIDADTICRASIDELFTKFEGSNFLSNVLAPYTSWVSDEDFKSSFGLEKTQTINSSWMYWESAIVFDAALREFNKGFDISKLSDKWGGVLPDELFFNAALAQTKTDAKTDEKVMYFDSKNSAFSYNEIENYSLITFFGNKKTSHLELQEWYDKTMFKYCTAKGIDHRFKIHEILANKLVNDK